MSRFCAIFATSTLFLHGGWHELVAKDMAFVYWMDEKPRSEKSVRMLSDAIVMMRSTNPKNLNLPFMPEDYFHKLNDEENSHLAEMYLRNAPQPVPNDRFLAADQYFDEMLALLRMHYAEDSPQVVQQKCAGMILKSQVNKVAEAEEFYSACSESTPSEPHRLLLDAYRRKQASERN